MVIAYIEKTPDGFRPFVSYHTPPPLPSLSDRCRFARGKKSTNRNLSYLMFFPLPSVLAHRCCFDGDKRLIRPTHMVGLSRLEEGRMPGCVGMRPWLMCLPTGFAPMGCGMCGIRPTAMPQSEKTLPSCTVNRVRKKLCLCCMLDSHHHHLSQQQLASGIS